jgi:hypothetical protein
MKNQIILAGGSIQSIPSIPENIKSLYKIIYIIIKSRLSNINFPVQIILFHYFQFARLFFNLN